MRIRREVEEVFGGNGEATATFPRTSASSSKTSGRIFRASGSRTILEVGPHSYDSSYNPSNVTCLTLALNEIENEFVY